MCTQRLQQLVGRFNGHLEFSIVVGLQDFKFRGDESDEGKLRSMITDSQKTFLERKCENGSGSARLFNNFIVTTNFKDAMPGQASSERRFVYFDVSEARRCDFAYFEQLDDAWNRRERAQFVALLSQPLEEQGWRAREHLPSVSRLKADVIIASNPVMGLFSKLLARNEWIFAVEKDKFYDKVEQRLIWHQTWRCEVPEEMFSKALEFELKQPELYLEGSSALLHNLQHQRLPTLRAWLGNAFGLPPLRRIINLQDPAAQQVIYLKKTTNGDAICAAPLAELRAAFAKAIGDPNHFAKDQ